MLVFIDIILFAISCYAWYIVGRRSGKKNGYDLGFKLGSVYGKAQAQRMYAVVVQPKPSIKSPVKRGRPVGLRNKVVTKSAKK